MSASPQPCPECSKGIGHFLTCSQHEEGDVEPLHPPRGYWLGQFRGGAAIMVGCWATLAEAEAARAESAATVGSDDLQVYITGIPEGWHTWCGAENGPLFCTRQAGHEPEIGHDNGSVWWPADV